MRDNAEKAGKGPKVEERQLFHGTSNFETVRGICINNFDHRLCGEYGTGHGNGAYFATTVRDSHRFTSPPERYLFLARVLVGEYTNSDPSYTRPPAKPGSVHDLYDSCVDNVENPSIFVVFDTKQYYPEFLLLYHSMKDALEQTKPIQPQKPIITTWSSYEQTVSSDFIGDIDRNSISNPCTTQIIPPSDKDKDSEKISGRQARENTRSSASSNLATSNKSSEGCSGSSRAADLTTTTEHRTADRGCSGTTKTDKVSTKAGFCSIC